MNFRIAAVPGAVLATNAGGKSAIWMTYWRPMPKRAGARPAAPSRERQGPTMRFGWYALWFIVAVSLLVTVHEFGHFWVARLGFKVLRFSIGFGRPLTSASAPDGTEFAIAAIPLGGYVRMLDEREGPVPTSDLGRSFTRKPPWQRILVLLAGPAFNIVFAILVLWGMLWFKASSRIKTVVGDIVGLIADRAGLRSDDEILRLGTPSASGARRPVRLARCGERGRRSHPFRAGEEAPRAMSHSP